MDRRPKMFLLLAITVGIPAEGLVAKSFFYRHAEGQRCGSPLATSLVSSLTGCVALCTQGNSVLPSVTFAYMECTMDGICANASVEKVLFVIFGRISLKISGYSAVNRQHSGNIFSREEP